MERNFLMSWHHIETGRWWTALTAAFSHIELNHFLVNMISFHQLSQILVYTPGLQAGTIVTLALGSAVAGSVAFVAHQEASKTPLAKSVGLGASGLVMGITGAVACLAPRQKMAIFGIIPVPMWAIGVFTAAYNVYFVGASSRVAHDAHLGGAIFGVLFYILRLRKFGGIMGGSSSIWPRR
jgi:membrane associated rhomboid family serine protease